MLGEFLEMFVEAIGVEPLDRAGQRSVQRATAIVEEAGVGHVLCQRVLEGVVELRDNPGFVDEFGRLQAAQAAVKGFGRKAGDGLEEDKRDLLADHGSDLQEMSVLRSES